MSILKLPMCYKCGAPHVPEDVKRRVRKGEKITVEIVYSSGYASNILRWGTGAINIDACRIKGTKPNTARGAGGQNGRYGPIGAQGVILDDGKGRYPANLLHDGSDEVRSLFPNSKSRPPGNKKITPTTQNVYGHYDKRSLVGHTDEGSAARYFYCAKTPPREKNGSSHPTIKPLRLLRYLTRLITPPGGIVLDHFAGTGTTGYAAYLEGFDSILIEQSREYVRDTKNRFRPLLVD